MHLEICPSPGRRGCGVACRQQAVAKIACNRLNRMKSLAMPVKVRIVQLDSAPAGLPVAVAEAVVDAFGDAFAMAGTAGMSVASALCGEADHRASNVSVSRPDCLTFVALGSDDLSGRPGNARWTLRAAPEAEAAERVQRRFRSGGSGQGGIVHSAIVEPRKHAVGGKKLCAHGRNPSHKGGLRQPRMVTPPFRCGPRHRHYSRAARTAGPSKRSRSTGSLANTKRI